jgi:hypothetical protein
MMMIDNITKNLSILKRAFKKSYSGQSNIKEVIPISPSESFPIDTQHLKQLCLFFDNNPIYHNSYKQSIGGFDCIIHEGDINRYWLNSIQHNSSLAPFSPTWVLSAYFGTYVAKLLNSTHVIDIGSGDGRIAYCAKILGLNSCGIELDESLTSLQKSISSSTMIDFNPNHADAMKFDYSKLGLINPAFFIGGLAHMGGDVLANHIIDRINNSIPHLKQQSIMVFAGTTSKKYPEDELSLGGWGKIIKNHHLDVLKTISLPAVWTFDEPDDVMYIFAKFS